MSNHLILYIGEREAGQALAALAEQENSYAYLPGSLMQALGMYIAYFPDVTVIDMSTSYGVEAFAHLRSVDAKPILLLTNERVRLASVYTIPPDASAEAVLRAIDHMEQSRHVPNGVLHYA